MKQAARIRVWDLPTRVFHWLLAVSVLGAVVTGKMGGNLIDWHGRIGLVITGLLAFRLVWGMVGSTYVRFAHFLPTPVAVAAYLRGHWRAPGHSPLAALSVLALLALLAAQVLTGLVANDDIAFFGPLHSVVSSQLSNRLTGLHHRLAGAIVFLVALHIAAIVFYAVFRKRNLVKPMLTGWTEGTAGESARGGGALRFVVALLLALAAVCGASGAWLPAPEPVPAADTPDW